ncbi:MAG: right-handed parallel beta-helix repeat-containing protein [Phycisphaerales bacterium]|nr:MAG: right-handed parallel beta-helix repeat-containing protein [Phycisphaerales bacterium]
MRATTISRMMAGACGTAALFATAGAGHAAMIHVPGDYDTIQQAVNGSDHGDTIIVADGEYRGPGFHEIHLRGKRITVRSENGPETCILDCENAYRGFYLYEGETPDSHIEGFTVINGYGTYGGGIRISKCDPTVVNCVFFDCSATEKGGGLFCYQGNPAVTGCTFEENRATKFGGGMYFDGANPTITGCTLLHNYSEMYPGGGIYFHNGDSVTIADTDIINNHCSHHGGGVYCSDSNLIVTGCTISDNGTSETHGGGMYCEGGSLTISDCDVTDNYAYDDGGGICCVGGCEGIVTDCLISGNQAGGTNQGYGGGILGASLVANCIIADNWAREEGGGVRGGLVINCLIIGNHCNVWGGGMCHGQPFDCTFVGNTAGESGGGFSAGDPGSRTTLSNCIFWGNSPDQIDEDSAFVSYCCVQGGWEGAGEHVTDDYPMFVDPDGPDNDPETWLDNDYHLGPGSPCIDAGDNTAVPDGVVTDLDGNPRFYDDPDMPDTGFGDPPIVDIGAYEVQVPSCPADVNDSGKVDIQDVFDVLGAWGPCDDPDDCPSDVNFDGVVDIEDIFAVLAAWGPCP